MTNTYNDETTTITIQNDNTVTIVQNSNEVKDTQQVVVLSREQWQSIVSEVAQTYMLKDKYFFQ